MKTGETCRAGVASQPSTGDRERRNSGEPTGRRQRGGTARSARSASEGRGRVTRVVVISHGHPIESPAGGEIAAYGEFLALSERPDVRAIFVAASANGLLAEGEVRPVGDARRWAEHRSELIVGFGTAPSAEGRTDRLTPPHEELLSLICGLAPDELRIHHFFRIGLEFLFALRLRLPATRFVFVAHEMMTICEANGHMVKEHTGALCYRASPLECSWCFSAKGQGYFVEREMVMRSFVALFDAVTAPSRFLVDRLIAWGVPASKIAHAGYDLGTRPRSPWPLVTDDRPLVLGFVGHVSRHKGVLLLLDAVGRIPAAARPRLRLRIHGLLHPNTGDAFRRAFEERLGSLGDCVSYEGAFPPEALPSVMDGLDGVVVPSLWWENAPLVIVEAARHGLPTITADVGGMKELGIDAGGKGFRFGSAADLARVIIDLIAPRSVADPSAGVETPRRP